MIRANFVHNYNGAALEAHRIRTSHAVIVRFNGNKVPANVMYCGALIRCRIYRQHKEVCKTCGQLGHRRSHPTGTGNCAKKFKTLFLLRRHEHERKTGTERARKFGQSKIRFSGKDDFPVLLKSAQRECSNSRSESTERARSREHSANCNRQRSLSRDRAWTDVVQGGAKSKTDAKTRQPSRTPARKPRNDPLTAKMLQLESTSELMQEFMRQQQETTTSRICDTHLARAPVGQAVECKRSTNNDARPIGRDGCATTNTAAPKDGQDPQEKERPSRLDERVGQGRGPEHGQRCRLNRIRLADLKVALQEHRGPRRAELQRQIQDNLQPTKQARRSH
ncbi:hypothetical protein HPB51_015475 [Rhipicephalus microplus]|uniref:Uncharacterized protein n=1 Tax=Rhipicephalus microplus TaxID=6941 RepID=A0A9J6EHH7_RHIMP|nr:hypothetical protein HPB51_015475 [Rhipicephalus microplus]